MNSETFLILFCVFYFLHQGIEIFLILLNEKYSEKQKDQVPDFYKDKISLEEYKKSRAYTKEKSRFALIQLFFSAGLFWVVILSGFLEKYELILIENFQLSSMTLGVAYCLGLALMSSVIGIPFSLYSTFKIEEKYGFNKMTMKLFFVDWIKGLLIGFILGTPILYLIFWFYYSVGDLWWLYAFILVFSFQFIVAGIYPTVLAPIFNKFTPLEEGELKEKIYALAKKVKFKMSGIYTIDGSKRSSHSNAYFAGMGKFRRIVLFDTIRDQLNLKEIISVLAHEMGHNVKKHIQIQMVLSSIILFVSFYVLGLLMNWEVFFEVFQAGSPSPHKALVLFGFLSSTFTFWTTPIMNFISRRNEYEADAFSVEVAKDPESMISSLVKLSKENLSNLTPHPWYSFYHYSHPTTSERANAIQRLAESFS